MADLDFADDPRRGCAPGKVAADAFFAERHSPGVELARAACNGCPFRQQCLEQALDRGEQFGIFGGVLMSSKPERRRAVAARQIATDQRLREQLLELWRQELPDSTIALRLGRSPGDVCKLRNRLGLAALYGPGGRRRQAVAA